MSRRVSSDETVAHNQMKSCPGLSEALCTLTEGRLLHNYIHFIFLRSSNTALRWTHNT
ncbi:hypothetical protein B0H34DRAFT_738712, partial [Crassisporium funariophilum]